MEPDDDVPNYDDDQAFCEGDVAVEDIDWDQVTALQEKQAAIMALPEGEERSTGMLWLLSEMHGEELEVL